MSNYGWGEWADREELFAALESAGLVEAGRKVGVWYITTKGRQAFTLLRSLVHADEDNGPIWRR